MTTEEAPIAQAHAVDEYTSPVSSYQLLLRLRIQNRPGQLGKVTTTIGEMGADIGSIDIAEARTDLIIRDFRIYCIDEENARAIVARVATIPGVEVQHASDRTFQLHRRGKIEVQNRVHSRSSAELSHVYTPGVARVSMQIHDNPDAVWSLTIKPNTVAVVTDGTAVLGLGDISPEAAMPVMEGKSMLFKSFGNMAAGHILLAIIFLLTGFEGLFGWALSGSLGGILMGIPGGAVLIAFTTGFLLPLKILVAFLQAFIFCMLSMLYLAGAVEEAEHH